LPFPGRLAFDECGEPFLTGDNGKASEDLSELLQFDQWTDSPGCGHDRGMLASVRIGNIALVGHVRNWIDGKEKQSGRRFAVLSDKVVYDGTHCGDCISCSDAHQLLQELEVLRTMVEDEHHKEFIGTMKQLCKASLTSGNPIVF